MGWKNLFHCEIEEYKVSRLKINFPKSISYGNITTTDFSIWRNRIDVLTGGFPCQDASIAKQDGKGQQGLQGARTGLFWSMVRAIDEIRPRFVVAENVANFLKVNGGKDFRTVLSELARMGYNAEWRVCRASDIGAPHHRARLYIIAYSNSIRLPKGQSFFQLLYEKASSVSWEFAGTTIQTFRTGSWANQPPILCVDDGVSPKLVRQSIHGYGNSVVPQIPYAIFKAIQELNNKLFINKIKIKEV